MKTRILMSNFLFELGTEEVPTSEIQNLTSQLEMKFKTGLESESIGFSRIETYSTNRRFTVFISDISIKAKDKTQIVKGPPKRIAFDKKDQPTIPLIKFLESNQIGLSAITLTPSSKGEHITYKKFNPGKTTEVILQDLIPRILRSIEFKKSMVWNESRIPFIRPIRNLLTILNKKLIKIEFANVQSSEYIRGHSLLSDEPLSIKSFKDYIEELHKNFVIIDKNERKEKILHEINEFENDLQVKCSIVDKLLHYHIYNNEYPVVFYGTFSKEYLELPQEIISTFMVDEKKLFPTYDESGKLSTVFIGVSNVPDENKFVSSGNSKIIKATFEDARFFWESDNQNDFLALREGLKNITFYKKNGNFFDKTERIMKISQYMLKISNLDPKLKNPLKKAALHCKNDLSTQMVREFPSLQGIMGGLYYREACTDDPKEIYQAIYNHYQPKGFTKTPDFSSIGLIIALTDKLDNITTLISSGVKVTGSKDPYGLRRDCNAVIKIIIDHQPNIDLVKTIDFCLHNLDREDEDVKNTIINFFVTRIGNCFKDILNLKYDIVDGVISKNPFDISNNYRKITQIIEMTRQNSLLILVSLHKRLKNILKDYAGGDIKPKLLKEDAELILYEILAKSKDSILNFIEQQDYKSACSDIIEMKPVIDDFFDKILVMDKNEKIKQNRLGLLFLIDSLLSKVADFSLMSD
jgi:glycyl-tRNA synthetase beta chain